ncbi:hypothetical protein FHS29_005544 [Saccharothrix tamanrassetensis]|uniref:Uncharacterized protein n=1 Tax=Saccharothrix tamanrassetensis TaxID=1051531 RepID=A0A841CSI6_9PSEU|nr:hypothetical protein [Saccharothrix tamanrassetensis]
MWGRPVEFMVAMSLPNELSSSLGGGVCQRPSVGVGVLPQRAVTSSIIRCR